MPLQTGPRETKTGPIRLARLPSSPIDRIRIGPGRVEHDRNTTGRPETSRAEPDINQDRIRAGRLVDSLAGLMGKGARRARREETTAPPNRDPGLMIRIAAARRQADPENRVDRLMDKAVPLHRDSKAVLLHKDSKAVLLRRDSKAVLLRRDSKAVRERGDPGAVLPRPGPVNLSSVHLFHGREALPPGLSASRLEKEALPKRPLANPDRDPTGAPSRKIPGTIPVP